MFEKFKRKKELHSKFQLLNNEAMIMLKHAENRTVQTDSLNEVGNNLSKLLEELIDANLIVDAGLVINSITLLKLYIENGKITIPELQKVLQGVIRISKESPSINERGAYKQAMKYLEKLIKENI